MQPSFSVNIQPVWHLVRKIRQDVATALAQYPAEIRSAAMMTASELVENAIKYGEVVVEAPDIHFALTAREDGIRIETVNGCTNHSGGVDELLKLIDELSRTADKGTLYLARLEQLLASPSETGRLGLYRIAFEGRFELACNYEDGVVTMIATRNLP